MISQNIKGTACSIYCENHHLSTTYTVVIIYGSYTLGYKSTKHYNIYTYCKTTRRYAPDLGELKCWYTINHTHIKFCLGIVQHLLHACGATKMQATKQTCDHKKKLFNGDAALLDTQLQSWALRRGNVCAQPTFTMAQVITNVIESTWLKFGHFMP